MFFWDILLLTRRVTHTGKCSLIDRSETKLSDILALAVVYTWSIRVDVVGVMRVDSVIN